MTIGVIAVIDNVTSITNSSFDLVFDFVATWIEMNLNYYPLVMNGLVYSLVLFISVVIIITSTKCLIISLSINNQSIDWWH